MSSKPTKFHETVTPRGTILKWLLLKSNSDRKILRVLILVSKIMVFDILFNNLKNNLLGLPWWRSR